MLGDGAESGRHAGRIIPNGFSEKFERSQLGGFSRCSAHIDRACVATRPYTVPAPIDRSTAAEHLRVVPVVDTSSTTNTVGLDRKTGPHDLSEGPATRPSRSRPVWGSSSDRRSNRLMRTRRRRANARASSSPWSNPRCRRREGEAGTHVTRSASGAASAIARANSETAVVSLPYFKLHTNSAARPAWGHTEISSWSESSIDMRRTLNTACDSAVAGRNRSPGKPPAPGTQSPPGTAGAPESRLHRAHSRRRAQPEPRKAACTGRGKAISRLRERRLSRPSGDRTHTSNEPCREKSPPPDGTSRRSRLRSQNHPPVCS